jgi:hypothetical protein
VKICPYDCTVCIKPECRIGCERTGESMMEPCDGCGVLFVAVRYAMVCLVCLNREP